MKTLFKVLFVGMMICSMAYAGTVSNLTPGFVKGDPKALDRTAAGTAPRTVTGAGLDDRVAPFPEGFEGTTGTLPPTGWLVVNVNADASLWKSANYTQVVHSGLRGMYYQYSSVNVANDWLISAATTLTGGVTYRLSFYEQVGSGYPERYEIMYGTTQSVAGMTDVIVGPTDVDNDTWALVSYDFTPSATNVYYIGWHCISDADMWFLAIDDIDLNEAPVGGRCCYGNPIQCLDGMDEQACAALGGTFTNGLDCNTPCPIPCDQLVACGPSSEVEPNDICPPPAEQVVIGCDAVYYGMLCPETDVDYFMVSVPAGYRMSLNPYDGEGCLNNPATCVVTDVYYDDCTLAGSGSTAGWNLSNPGTVPWVVYLAVRSSAGCRGAYKLVSTCCPILNYCENPIWITGVYHFEQTVNTCCALPVYAGTYEDACAGSNYGSGPQTIFKFCLLTAGTLTLDVTGPGSADEQMMVFTDCADPLATCVGSQDMEAGALYGETILALSLPAGCYYVGISYYSSTGTTCGDLTLTIDSDVPLPVELMDFTATPGDGAVSLAWRTASEMNNARFEIVRNGEIIRLEPSQGEGATERRYTYTDNSVENGTVYRYDLVSVDQLGNRATLQSASAMPVLGAAAVTEYRLLQNYPNPFNPSTTVAFDMLDNGVVSLKVFNLLGQEVATMANGMMTAGRHTLTWDAGNLPSGIYLARLEVNGFAAEKKMLLMK